MKTINKKNIFLFIITFILILFKYLEIWSYLFNNEFYKSRLLIITSIILLSIFIFNTKIEKDRIKKILIYSLIVLLLTYLSKSIDFIISFLLVVSYSIIKDGNSVYIKHFCISSVLLFLITLLMNIIGILPSYSIKRVVNGIIIYRSNLGFLGANNLFLFLYPIIISILYLNYNKTYYKKFLLSFLILIFTFIFYKITDCRTGILCIILSLLAFNIPSILKNKIIKFILKYYYLIFTIISLFLAYKFNNSENKLNVLSSGRFYYWYYYLKNVRFTLFGVSKFNLVPLDNYYLNIYFIYGFISYILINFISLFSFKRKYDEKYILCLFSFAIYGLFENNIAYVFSFLLFNQLYSLVCTKEGDNK